MDEELLDVDSLELALTIEGEVLGTPSYMPPEQAQGRTEEVDERSDIYSLGAILYEILTLRPPFEGPSKQSVLTQVVNDDPVPPSVLMPGDGVVDERRTPGFEPFSEGPSSDPETQREEGHVELEPVPPELEEIVLRALAKRKVDRYATVRELVEDIQAFLEGEKQREFNHRQALAKVEEGKSLVEALGILREKVKAAEKEAEERQKGIKPFWPVEKKTDLWALQDRIKTMEEEIVRMFTKASRNFQTALEFERKNPQARQALAALYWEQFLREEEAGDRAEMIRNENLAREYNDGQYDALLKGDGTLAISTGAYSCSCLVEGKPVEPDEMEVMGFHPFSGRDVGDPREMECLKEFEPREPIRLKIHGEACSTAPLEGTDVWIYRLELREKIRMPARPDLPGIQERGASAEDGKPGSPGIPPAEVLDRLYDEGSPYRPTGEALYLGKTPIHRFPIPMGSYLLILHHPADSEASPWAPVRAPVLIERMADRDIDITLYREAELPRDVVQVPAGTFIYQGDRGNMYSGPKEICHIDDFFVARFPVTCREYLQFLNDLKVRDPEQARMRVPRDAEAAAFHWPEREEGGFAVPTAAWLASAPEEKRKEASRLPLSPIDWEEDWPVMAISWNDAMAYGVWFTREGERLFGLPHETMWEKCARGPDARLFPWSDHFDSTYGNTFHSWDGPHRPCPIGAFPLDESPYGIRDLGGNSMDLCLNDVEDGRRRFLRGGSWMHQGDSRNNTTRAVFAPRFLFQNVGLRLCWFPKTKTKSKRVMEPEPPPTP
jgi:formylglycine-generating enzyme required for sulfatase activity